MRVFSDCVLIKYHTQGGGVHKREKEMVSQKVTDDHSRASDCAVTAMSLLQCKTAVNFD